MSSRLADLQSQLKDKLEEVRVLKIQVKWLKDTLSDKEDEAERWKAKAFESVQVSNQIDEKSIENSPKYRGLQDANSNLEARLNKILSSKKTELEALTRSHKDELNNANEKLMMLEEELAKAHTVSTTKIQSLEEKLQTLSVKANANIDAKKFDELQENYDKKCNELDIFQHEAKGLMKNVETLTLENSQLIEQNEMNAQRVLSYQQRLEAMERARYRMRSPKEAQKDKEFQERCDLPETEIVITWFSCNLEGTSGYLYVLPSYIVFEESTVAKIFSRVPPKIIGIADILKLDKVKASTWVPGKGAAVEVTTRKAVYLFKHFMKRKECMNAIVAQAECLGHEIATFREGLPSVFDMRHEADEKLEESLRQSTHVLEPTDLEAPSLSFVEEDNSSDMD